MSKRTRRIWWRKHEVQVKQYALGAFVTIVVILILGIVGHFDQTAITSYQGQ